MNGKNRAVLEVRHMSEDDKKTNYYGMGALEALSWARAVLSRCRTLDELEEAREEIGKMITSTAKLKDLFTSKEHESS